MNTNLKHNEKIIHGLHLEGVAGDTFYIDKGTIKKHESYVYWWQMGSYKNPVQPYEEIFDDRFNGAISSKHCRKGDCGVVRYKELSVTYYKQKMGDGKDDPLISGSDPWEYPPPNTVNGFILKYVCDYVD